MQRTAQNPDRALSWLIPLLFAAALGLYFVLRFGGLWSEMDSANFSDYIRNVHESATLNPERGSIYPNGYSFQAIGTFVINLTGVDVTYLQQLFFPLTVVLIVLPAWALYRELSGSDRGAMLGVLLLLIQPEFLFVVLRGSHERFTRILIFVALWLLARSLRLRDRMGVLAAHVALFYLVVYAMIASNNLLANSFIAAVALAFGLGWLIDLRAGSAAQRPLMRRLVYITLISLGLVFLFTFYIYPPARQNLFLFQSLWERIAALFLDVQTRSTNPYTQVSTGWISLPVYFAVSSANWIILLSSLLIWAQQTWAWLRWREAPRSNHGRLLWLLYTAFAAQGAISVVVDASGALAGNLQHRLFPSFAIVAVAMTATALDEWLPQRLAVGVRISLAALCGVLAFGSMLKATNEPLLSNKWTFYRPSEMLAMDWADGRLNATEVWTEYDERLQVAYVMERSYSPRRNAFHGFGVRPTTRVVLLSEITRLRSLRLNQPLPNPPDALRIYDNGSAELYRLRPTSPYQR